MGDDVFGHKFFYCIVGWLSHPEKIIHRASRLSSASKNLGDIKGDEKEWGSFIIFSEP